MFENIEKLRKGENWNISSSLFTRFFVVLLDLNFFMHLVKGIGFATRTKRITRYFFFLKFIYFWNVMVIFNAVFGNNSFSVWLLLQGAWCSFNLVFSYCLVWQKHFLSQSFRQRPRTSSHPSLAPGFAHPPPQSLGNGNHILPFVTYLNQYNLHFL